MLMQYLTPDQRKSYKQGDFAIYDRPGPDDSEQQRLRQKYEEERSGDAPAIGYRVARGICSYCGQEFYQWTHLYYGRQSKKYCSARCRNDAYIERRKQRRQTALNKICAVCGKEYTAKKIDSMYCGQACKQIAYRRRLIRNQTNENQ